MLCSVHHLVVESRASLDFERMITYLLAVFERQVLSVAFSVFEQPGGSSHCTHDMDDG